MCVCVRSRVLARERKRAQKRERERAPEERVEERADYQSVILGALFASRTRSQIEIDREEGFLARSEA